MLRKSLLIFVMFLVTLPFIYGGCGGGGGGGGGDNDYDTFGIIECETNGNCQGCCSGHGGLACKNGRSVCWDGSPLSETCRNKGCSSCVNCPREFYIRGYQLYAFQPDDPCVFQCGDDYKCLRDDACTRTVNSVVYVGERILFEIFTYNENTNTKQFVYELWSRYPVDHAADGTPLHYYEGPYTVNIDWDHAETVQDILIELYSEIIETPGEYEIRGWLINSKNTQSELYRFYLTTNE